MASSNNSGTQSLKGSKYQDLRSPVVCEWILSTNHSICGCCFTDVTTFSTHVKEHYEQPVNSDAAVCKWAGCDFVTKDGSSIIEHLLFHPFHMYLKLLGKELQARLNLPICQIDEQYQNLVPPIHGSLKCQWDNGKCTALFESIGEYFFHVQDHVTAPFQCKWKGTVYSILYTCNACTWCVCIQCIVGGF